MRALVTGGTGFVGRAIVERLQARGDRVRVLARQPAPELATRGVDVVPGDLRDEAAVIAACEQMDAVFHTAAHVAAWGPWKDFDEVNVRGTQHVLVGCRRHGVSRLIYTSTPSVVLGASDVRNGNETLPYPQRSLSFYARSKAEAEQEVLAANGQHDLLTVALRPHAVFGPGDRHLVPRLLQQARAGRLRIIGHGRQRADVTYVDNAAQAHVLAADRLTTDSPVAGQVYFITQGEPVTIWDFINDLLERCGLPRVTRTIPYSLARAIAWGLEGVHAACRWLGEPRLTRYTVALLGTSHFFDVSKATHDLGYRPIVSTEEGLARTAAHFRPLLALRKF